MRNLRQGRRGRASIIGVGVIAAAALTVGGAAVATSAASGPTRASQIPNLTNVKNDIKAYYGDAGSHDPSTTSAYAKEVGKVEKLVSSTIRYQVRTHPKPTNRAIVFDVDDTTLSTYRYESLHDFGYDPVVNNDYIQNIGMPGVFGMAAVADLAVKKGYTVYYLTGRPETQRGATLRDLTAAGYPGVDTGHLFMRNKTAPPAYLPCEPTCTTIQYKSLTRKYIDTTGVRITIDVGDQYSDLKGGYAGRTFKVPNPMYYLP